VEGAREVDRELLGELGPGRVGERLEQEAPGVADQDVRRADRG
jgi:hypothetical protein